MSESYKEQHPLLSEELSEEENFGQHFSRRLKPIFRGRARNQAKGAANIINQWPDHWTTSASHWWIVLGMITITVFVIYNSILAITLLPVTNSKPIKTENNFSDNSLPKVFMHLLVNNNDEVDLNKYLPYIETLAKQHVGYKYQFIIVLNDTNSDNILRSAEENNEIALNSLWSNENILGKVKSVPNNVKIKHILLSTYMNKSPLKKHWRKLPSKFIGFLLRAVAIWDNGGIAFNPDIITPWSPHTIYAEKLNHIFQKYQKCRGSDNQTVPNIPKVRKHHKQKDKVKKKVNNIQDIINILEHENDPMNMSQYSLTEAESNNSPIAVSNTRKLLSMDMNLVQNSTDNNDIKIKPRSERNTGQGNKTKRDNDVLNDENILIEDRPPNSMLDPPGSNKTMKFGLLPLFLEFLFHDKTKLFPKIDMEIKDNTKHSRQRKSVIPLEKDTEESPMIKKLNTPSIKQETESKPMIILAKGIVNDTGSTVPNITDNAGPIECGASQLTIDLKGNILAAEVPCHAFLGTVFTDVVHYTDKDELNDFIISELSIFCKGLLTTCKGIDVILL